MQNLERNWLVQNWYKEFIANLGGIFMGSFWGGVGGKITPCLKPVRIMLETSDLARKYTPICSLRKFAF